MGSVNCRCPPLIEKLLPLTVKVVSAVVEAVIVVGVMKLIEGAGRFAAGPTVKGRMLEGLPPGFTTCTDALPAVANTAENWTCEGVIVGAIIGFKVPLVKLIARPVWKPLPNIVIGWLAGEAIGVLGLMSVMVAAD